MKWKEITGKLLRDKGYYLAFAVCLAAVAVSGWLFVRSLDGDAARQPEAVPAAVLPTLSSGEERAAADRPGKTVGPRHAVPPAEPAATEKPRTTPETGPSAEPGAVLCRPVEGEQSQAYSMDKLSYNATTRDWRTHAGMDIAAAPGAEVKAVAEGTVLSVFADDLLGQTVAVEHAGGWVTHYANLAEEVCVKAGDRVSAGQVLGTVGKTALAEIAQESHLHFAVYKNNVPQDPEAYLAG